VVSTACKFVHEGAAPAMHEQLHCAGPPSAIAKAAREM
jgi:hypothetical protein